MTTKARAGRRWRSYGERSARRESAVAAPAPEASTLDVLAYGPDGHEEVARASAEDIARLACRWPVIWVDVSGSDPGVLAMLAQAFGLHGLALEDVVHAGQRPKLETYPNHLFLIMRMVSFGERVETEQVSLFLGKGFLVTFQEGKPGDCYGGVRDRIRTGLGPLRASGPDYLLYQLVDAMVDSQFPAREALGERIEEMEGAIIAKPDPAGVLRIQDIKHDLLVMRRIAFPARDALGALYRDPTPLVAEGTRLYLRDCHDHAVQIMDLVETYRELASGLMDVYLSSVSNRMNEVMKVLTIIATIFMPLSFIAGVYGMNFETSRSRWNMPELKWVYGYPYALGLMAAVAVTMLGFFHHRGWLQAMFRAPLPPRPEGGGGAGADGSVPARTDINVPRVSPSSSSSIPSTPASPSSATSSATIPSRAPRPPGRDRR